MMPTPVANRPPRSTVHVAWGANRANSVRSALRLLGDDSPVIALTRTLSLGPIAVPGDPKRLRWLATNTIDFDGGTWRETDDEAPWSAATRPGRHPVFWLCRYDTGEFASFLAFMGRMRGRDVDVVDVTGVCLPFHGVLTPIKALGQLRPMDIVTLKLETLRRPYGRDKTELAADHWDMLRLENAPLRVVQRDQLVSASVTHFDALLCSMAPASWEPLPRMIGQFLDRTCATDTFLYSRIFVLRDAGRLELRGSGPGMPSYEVRRHSG